MTLTFSTQAFPLTSNQSVSTATNTLVNWPITGTPSVDVSISSGVLTVSRTAEYTFCVTFVLQGINTTAPNIKVWFQIDSNTLQLVGDSFYGLQTVQNKISTTFTTKLNANQTVKIYFYQGSGTSLDLIADTTSGTVLTITEVY